MIELTQLALNSQVLQKREADFTECRSTSPIEDRLSLGTQNIHHSGATFKRPPFQSNIQLRKLLRTPFFGNVFDHSYEPSSSDFDRLVNSTTEESCSRWTASKSTPARLYRQERRIHFLSRH